MTRSLALLFFVLSLVPNSGSAQVQSARELSSSAYVAEIVSVPGGERTNGNPPILDIKVVDGLGSKLPLGLAKYRWDDPLFILCGVGEEARIAEWNAKPVALPAKGSRWIIYRSHPVLPYGERFPDSEENRKMILERIKSDLESLELNLRKAGEEKAEFEAKRTQWDRMMVPDVIREWTRKADLIVVGMVVSSSGGSQDIEVLRTLKGVHRAKQNNKYVTITGLKENRAFQDGLWTRDEEVIVFLSEHPIQAIPGYVLQGVGAGVILQTKQREEAISKDARESSTKKPIGAIAIGGDFQLSGAFALQLPDSPVVRAGITSFYPKAIQEHFEGIDWMVGLEQTPGTPNQFRLYLQKTGSDDSLQEVFSGELQDALSQARDFVLSNVKK